MEKEEALKLKNEVTNLFVKKKVDLTAPHIVASIAQVAGNMARVLDESRNPEDVHEAILNLYGASENEIARGIINSGASNIQGNIGFATDTMDYGRARTLYESQKEAFDKVYNGLDAYTTSLTTDMTK